MTQELFWSKAWLPAQGHCPLENAHSIGDKFRGVLPTYKTSRTISQSPLDADAKLPKFSSIQQIESPSKRGPAAPDLDRKNKFTCVPRIGLDSYAC